MLKEIRIAKNLRQVDVAKRLGMPQSFVSKYETGERRLDFVETVLVCEALKIGIKDFVITYTAKTAKLSKSKNG
jgi:transcriptional regulator with XRE-family HTH domain